MTAAMAFLPSCAYMQTHKNIEENGVLYKGAELKKDNISLVCSKGQWYIAAPAGHYSKRYPIIHDSIFFKEDNDPTYTLQQSTGTTNYFPISEGTATCLQRTDGYSQTGALASEINMLNGEVLQELKRPSTRAIRAELVEDEKPVTIIQEPVNMTEGSNKSFLSVIDMCTVDALGTLGYNLAIPFMAPFVFFSEFLSEE